MKNAVMGSRLDADLEGAETDCVSLHGEFRDDPDIFISNNNQDIDVSGSASMNNNDENTTENTGVGNGNNSIDSYIMARRLMSGNVVSRNISSSVVAESIGSQDVKFEKSVIMDTCNESGHLSATSSSVDKRRSSSEKSVSPIDKDNSDVIKEGSLHCIDFHRQGQVDTEIGSLNINKKNLEPRITTDKTCLGSSGSADSKSDIASLDHRDRHNLSQRCKTEYSSSEQLRIIPTNRDSKCFTKESNSQDVTGDLITGSVQVDDDNEPPAPAPGSQPVSPDLLGIDHIMVPSPLSALHIGPPVELAGTRRLRLENERLVAEVARLRQLLLSGAARGEIGSNDVAVEEETRFVALEMELQHSRVVIQALKTERKRLKAEKFDLLNQMKALYSTLEDKERELRDFIRNYEQRMRENEVTLGCPQQGAGLSTEQRERERWSLLRAARDEADRNLSLSASLAEKEAALSHAHAAIKELQRQSGERDSSNAIYLSDQESLVSFPRSNADGTLTPGASASRFGPLLVPQLSSQTPLCIADVSVNTVIGTNAPSTGQTGDRGSCSADSGVRGSSDRESGGATSVGGNLSDSTTDATTPKDCSPTLSPSNAFSKSMEASSMSRSVEHLSNSLDVDGRKNKPSPPVMAHTAHGRSSAIRGGPWGSISRVFARSRHRKGISNSVSSASNDASETFDSCRSWSPMTEDCYAEKLRLLREAATIPMERWRATTVLAWLEVSLGMPQYGLRCAENIKSGKVLLELNDTELEAGLGITHPLHRKKLRLAIEEHRKPNLLRYPNIGQLGHTWVSGEWLPDLGLSQYAESFLANMVDARMLDHVVKKELEKLLGVTRKFHQASIMHGINLLRMLQYDRQALALRRRQSEQVDEDPLVWTNLRFIKWARNIDLTEYADNLKDSGVHGALVVLEPSFTGDTMATALGIPPAKHMIRRHLTAELEALVLPARSHLEVVPRNHIGGSRPLSIVSAGESLGRGSRTVYIQHHRTSLSALHMAAADTANTNSGRRLSLRGSLSRAFGIRLQSEKATPSSLSDTGSFISHYQHMSAVRCNVPSPPQLPPRPTTNGDGNDNVEFGTGKRHRRVRSIGDIEYISNALASTSA